MAEMAMFSVQRAITQKVGKPEIPFMCSACRLILLYICMKFREINSDGIRVLQWKPIMKALMDGQMDGHTNFGRYNKIPLPPFVVGHKKGKSITLHNVKTRLIPTSVYLLK